MAVNIDHDNTYGKISSTDFNANTTTVDDVGGDETVLVINESTGAMTVYEWFNCKWYQASATYTP